MFPVTVVINVEIQVKLIYKKFLITISFSGVVLLLLLNKKKGRFHGEESVFKVLPPGERVICWGFFLLFARRRMILMLMISFNSLWGLLLSVFIHILTCTTPAIPHYIHIITND